MTDHDGSGEATERHEPRGVRVAVPPGHEPGPAAEADAGHGRGSHEAALGPIDVEAWATGVLGVAIGLAVAICFALSVGYIGT